MTDWGRLIMKKEKLLGLLETSREEFMDLLDMLDDEDFHEPGAINTWTIKDLLVHLTVWEAQLVTLLWQAKGGQRPTTVHFENLSDDEINARWYEENKDRPLAIVMDDFYGVRNQTIRRVEEFSEADLNNPERYPWLKTHPLADWIAGSSYEHDQEHLPDLRMFVSRKKAH
jgi:hypothetical protein